MPRECQSAGCLAGPQVLHRATVDAPLTGWAMTTPTGFSGVPMAYVGGLVSRLRGRGHNGASEFIDLPMCGGLLAEGCGAVTDDEQVDHPGFAWAFRHRDFKPARPFVGGINP
ncbi:MAG: hypothetical protein RLZZ214_4194 [Verrucomicrobiota bacterium]